MPNAATRDVGDFLGGRKTGAEDQLVGLLDVERVGLLRA